MLRALFLLFACLLTAPVAAEEIFPGYEWKELGDGIYLHTRSDPFAGPIDGNVTVIINEDDVFVVDAQINPAAARAVVAKIKSLTDKPVSHIVNTHWHDDHVNGNDTFRKAFPDAAIVAHPYTAKQLETEWREFEEGRVAGFETVTVEGLLSQADEADETDAILAARLRIYAGYVAALKPEIESMDFAYPDKFVEQSASFERGDREIIVKSVGVGNTEGDLVVWLPNERILITGDIVVAPTPYAYNAPMGKWIKTLENLKSIDAALIVPGHGAPMANFDYVDQLIALMNATLTQVSRAHEDGASLDDLIDHVDLKKFEDAFTGGDPAALLAWNTYFMQPGLKSAWEDLGLAVPAEE